MSISPTTDPSICRWLPGSVPTLLFNCIPSVNSLTFQVPPPCWWLSSQCLWPGHFTWTPLSLVTSKCHSLLKSDMSLTSFDTFSFKLYPHPSPLMIVSFWLFQPPNGTLSFSQCPVYYQILLIFISPQFTPSFAFLLPPPCGPPAPEQIMSQLHSGHAFVLGSTSPLG